MIRDLLPLILFTALYILGFTAWFLAIGNVEFLFYTATMAALIALVALTLNKAAYPIPLLWALTIWGLLHMAGGGVPVNGSVLYTLPLVPLVEDGEMTILKYDQVVHAYGFGITAWLLHHLLTRHFPDTRGTFPAPRPIAPSAGKATAVNEMIEFAAVLAVPDTNVGGYINTALDLCFNAAGAILGAALAARRPSSSW